MTTIDWRIPPSMTRWLAKAPGDAPVAVLLRHSVRGPLPSGDAGNAVPITPDGTHLAQRLGTMLGDRLRTLHASPVPRCVQTAEALRAGAGTDVPIVPDRLLGEPGVYVVDSERAWTNWETLGHEAVMRSLVAGNEALPGMADPDPAARLLVRHMLAVAGDRPGFHLFITHDVVITATVARLLGEPLGRKDWPWYLEGAFFRQEDGCISTSYRDRFSQQPATSLARLDERHAADLARRECATSPLISTPGEKNHGNFRPRCTIPITSRNG